MSKQDTVPPTPQATAHPPPGSPGSQRLRIRHHGVTLPSWGRALRRLLVPGFDLACRAGFHVKVRGLDHFHNQPATLIVANHKSDFDTIILIPTLFRAHRGRGPVRRAVFVAAEQMFEPGYVSMYLLKHQWRFIRRLLYPANMSALLQGIGAHPIPGSRRRKLGRHLRTIQDHAGDLPLGQVFSEPAATAFAGADATTRISRVLRWRYHDALDKPCGWSRFQPRIAKVLRTAHLKEVDASLAYFAGVLGAGGCMYIAPEGAISTDGGFEGVKAGVSRLIHAARSQITLLPVHFTYDSMTTGRGTAFLTIGPEMIGVQAWSRPKIEQATSAAIGKLSTITLPQLVAVALEGRLSSGPCEVAEADLRRELFAQAHELARRGYAVDDRLLDADTFDRRWRGFIAYCRKRHLARRRGEAIAFDPDAKSPGMEATWWRYAANELHGARKVAAGADPA